jgi:competence protein ComEC
MYKERGITGNKLALVAAMTLGQKNMLDQDQKQIFINAGVMHIMAVSGLHTVILSLFVFNILFFLKRRFNALRIVITIIFLWAFAFVTGLTPSVLRATLMFSFLHAGNLMKRKVNGINSVLASAFVLILTRPSVIFDAGFLLSYSAVIYIIAFYKDFYNKILFKNWISDKIWQSAVVTIIAQAGTLLLTIMLFNRFPTYFLLTNIIIVPLSSLLIIIGCLIPVLFPVNLISSFLALILNYLTGLTEYLTYQASSLPSSSIEGIGMTTIDCAILTAGMFLLTSFILKKNLFSVLYPISLLLIFITSLTVRDISNRYSNELIVYNTPGISTIGIKTGKILNLYSDSVYPPPEVRKHCSTQGLEIKSNKLINNNYCLKAGTKKILICNTADIILIDKFLPDIVIFTGLKPDTRNLNSAKHNTKSIIISSKSPSGYSYPASTFSKPGNKIYFVNKSGAFITQI